MRTFIGMILGGLLTIGAAYVHDSMVTSTVAGGAKTDISNMIVNWDVAARKWGYVTEAAHAAWLKLQAFGERPTTKRNA